MRFLESASLHREEFPSHRLARLGRALFAAFFLASAAFYSLTTLCAIRNFAWRQPMFDQWRMYEAFLGLPFPQNVVQLENGHRPIIPNLFRVAEIKWFHANQLLQIGVGTICLLATWCLLVAVVWRQRGASYVARSAGVMLVTLGLLWLANARMLLHGNESLHAYLLTLSVVCAALSTYEAHRRHSLPWLGLASGACAVAMFCFGPGVASFPAVIALGFMLRLPWRWLLLPVATLLTCLSLYFVLPGHEGVRGMISLHPIDSLLAAARWLSSPWVNGWLGFGDPPLYTWMATTPPFHTVAHTLRATAIALTDVSGTSWATISTWIGLAGMLGCGVRLGIALFSRRRPEQLETLVLGVGLFALATACVIGVGRLDYLAQHPDQIYADRYLLWPCLFWMSMAVLLLRDMLYSQYPAMRRIAYLPALALPIALLPTQSGTAAWGASVYRNSQATAAAVESGVYDEGNFPAAGVGRDATLREIALLREKRVAMFADPAWQRVGTHWRGTLVATADAAVDAHWLQPVIDPTTDGPAGHAEGWATHGIALLQGSGRLAILTEDGTIAGLAEWSFIGPNARNLRLSLPRKRGFDGYVRNWVPGKKYSLAVLDFQADRGILLATLPAQVNQ